MRSQASGEVRRLGPGDWFGEIGLLRGIPRTVSIVAAEDTSLLAVPGRVFVDAIAGRDSLPDPIEMGDVHPSRPDSSQAGYRPWPGVSDGSR